MSRDIFNFFVGWFFGVLVGGLAFWLYIDTAETPVFYIEKLARLEAGLVIPPENYFGDTVHCESVWSTPEKSAVEKYPGYRSIKLERIEGAYLVTLVWNGTKWPPDTLKTTPMKRRER